MRRGAGWSPCHVSLNEKGCWNFHGRKIPPGAAPQENKMGVLPIGRLLTNMAVPMMISMLVQACYNVVDSVFVAQISEDA
mgnify:CR=1 FL=1